MKAIDIAFKDITRSFRSTIAVVFMFGLPLMVTGLFYLMLGSSAREGEFDLPRTKVVIANLDEGGPKMQAGSENVPGGGRANTLGELVVNVLKSDDLAELIDVSLVPDVASARAAVDNQQAQVAVIIPVNFSHQFADPYGQAAIEFYQDPTLTIGPSIVKSIMSRFMDTMSGIKIALDVALEQTETSDYAIVGQVIQQYLDTSSTQTKDLAEALLDIRSPVKTAQTEENPVLRIIGPLMGAFMIFYAFYTGTSTAESILKEEEERTLPRLFTTPTPQATILTGKFLAVLLTVSVQVTVLLIAAHLIFGIQWGAFLSVALSAVGIVLSASSFGIFINSLLKTTRQGGVIFGGVLTLTGMVGMIGVISGNSPTGAMLSNTVALLVPQGWAVRGLLQTMNLRSLQEVAITVLVMFLWSVVFFSVGVWRFRRRYA